MKENIELLIKELFDGKFEKKFTEQDIANVANQKNVYPFYHRENGEIVAMLTMYVIQLFSRRLSVIEEVVTLKEWRNKGIGSELVAKAIKKAINLGCDCVELNVRDDKPDVQKFYQNLGFYDRKNMAMRLLLKST